MKMACETLKPETRQSQRKSQSIVGRNFTYVSITIVSGMPLPWFSPLQYTDDEIPWASVTKRVAVS